MERAENFIKRLTEGKEIELIIDNLNHSGEGVGRWEGIAVFVPFTAPGDRVRARISEVKKNYARASLAGIVEPAAIRANPSCDKYGSCGGCRVQHVAYEEQLARKTELVRQSIARIGGLHDVPVRPAIGMGHPWHYRNKVHFQVGYRGAGVVLGYYEEGTHCMAGFAEGENSHCSSPDYHCLLVDRDLIHLAGEIEEMLNRYGVEPFHWENGTGLLRHVLLRKGNGTGEMMAVLVTGPGEWAGEKRFAHELAGAVSGVKSVLRHINAKPGRQVLGGRTVVLYGEPFITDRLGELFFRLSAESFYQVNPKQTLTLYQKAAEYAGLTGTETVVDAYSGVGTIALFMAGKAGKIIGMELVPEAVRDARANAELNNIHNVEFHPGPVEKLLPRMARRGLSPDVVVLDPPRRGCHARVLETIAETKVPRVVYVSCDPGSLARDLGKLSGHGYIVKEVQPVDMFPHTHHCEVVLRLERMKG